MEVKIWGVTEGPIAIEEVSEEELEMAPIGSKFFMVCRTEIDGVVGEDNFWFEDFDDAYEWKKHFMKSIDPIVIDMDGTGAYN
jgi:hypothetical protein